MASLVQQTNMDVENPGGVAAGKRQLLSAGPRRGVGKIFSAQNENSLVTPRRALGDLSNNLGGRQPLGSVGNTLHRSSKGGAGAVLKKPQLGPQLKTPGLGLKVHNDGPVLKGLESKKKGLKVRTDVKKQTANVRKPSETFPDIENMKIFHGDVLALDRLPAEDCLTSHLNRLGSMKTTMFRYPVRDVDDLNPDFSHLSLDTMLRPSDNEPILPPSSTPASCLDLPPVDAFDFLDINNLVFD